MPPSKYPSPAYPPLTTRNGSDLFLPPPVRGGAIQAPLSPGVRCCAERWVASQICCISRRQGGMRRQLWGFSGASKPDFKFGTTSATLLYVQDWTSQTVAKGSVHTRGSIATYVTLSYLKCSTFRPSRRCLHAHQSKNSFHICAGGSGWCALTFTSRHQAKRAARIVNPSSRAGACQLLRVRGKVCRCLMQISRSLSRTSDYLLRT